MKYINKDQLIKIVEKCTNLEYAMVVDKIIQSCFEYHIDDDLFNPSAQYHIEELKLITTKHWYKAGTHFFQRGSCAIQIYADKNRHGQWFLVVERLLKKGFWRSLLGMPQKPTYYFYQKIKGV